MLQLGDTPLHWATIRGHTSVVSALVAAGADVNAKGGWVGGCGLFHHVPYLTLSLVDVRQG